MFLRGFCGFYDNCGTPHLYIKCSFFHPKTKPSSVDHEPITELKHKPVAANQKITKLDKLVQDLIDDVRSFGKFKNYIKTDLVGSLEDEMKMIRKMVMTYLSS